ncbi:MULTISPECIES: TIGR03943 family putative permease subunit [Sporosarcina]|uniref:TIGR03943 family putative permease subunit n=1 Tax=Sporosarcina TaxID=1569 RepID=UPI00058F3D34|nr:MULTISPECIES: TIGR03943 family protein [Sporosarcina]WJY27568.1 TIGR03943 family protein [Sporosarcina sp. 0.2-SM1T-5]
METASNYRIHALLRGLLLLGFFALLLRLLVTGDILLYIAPKMVKFSYIALAVLLILGIMQLIRSLSADEEELYCDCGFSHGPSAAPLQSAIIYLLFALPVLTGLWFPSVSLDSSIAAKRGFQYPSAASAPGNGEGIAADTGQTVDPAADVLPGDPAADPYEAAYDESEFAILRQELLDADTIEMTNENYMDVMFYLNDDPVAFEGKQLSMTGFVFKDPIFQENRFVIARFGISCCVADAEVYGIMSAEPPAAPFAEDEWLDVTGTLTTVQHEGMTLPFLEMSDHQVIDQPELPYVY